MRKIDYKYIIIGAGVSGLTTAYYLLQNRETNFIILEGRDRIGGRVLTKNTIDFGPAWFQPNHKNLSQLLNNLGIEKFSQYSKGKSIMVYNTNGPAHYFESDQTQPSAYRISGGSNNLIEKLSNFVEDKIVLNTQISKISEIENKIILTSNTNTFSAERVINTLPPKLATTLNYSPKLPNELNKVMHKTQTWMGHAIKVGITYKTPFWREQNNSGTIIGQFGAVTELYDHTNASKTNFSLMGFVNQELREVSAETRKEQILAYLEKYLGSQARNYLSYSEKDWAKDKFTSCPNLEDVYMSAHYGNPIFNSAYLNGKLLFSGTETAPYFGGYLEGAVISGILSAQKLLNTTKN